MISHNGTDADNTHTFEQCRSMVMVDDTATQNFTADLVQFPPQRRANIIKRGMLVISVFILAY